MDIASSLFDSLTSTYRKIAPSGTLNDQDSSSSIANNSNRSSSDALKLYDIHYKREQSLVSPTSLPFHSSPQPSDDSSAKRASSSSPSPEFLSRDNPSSNFDIEIESTMDHSTASAEKKVSHPESVPQALPVPIDWSWITTPTPPVSNSNRLPTSSVPMTVTASAKDIAATIKDPNKLKRKIGEPVLTTNVSPITVGSVIASETPGSSGTTIAAAVTMNVKEHFHSSTQRLTLSSLASEFVLLERTSSRGSFRSVHSSEFGDLVSAPVSPCVSPLVNPSPPHQPLNEPPHLPEISILPPSTLSLPAEETPQLKPQKQKHEMPGGSDHVEGKSGSCSSDDKGENSSSSDEESPWFREFLFLSSKVGGIVCAALGSYLLFKLSIALKRVIMRRIL